MAPKQPKKKEEEKGPTFSEVEKTMLELQVTEGNRKIVRLRAAVDELEKRNEELQHQYITLDEDRTDIIAYLKKTLKTKIEEIGELKERVKGLEETRNLETADFTQRISDLDKNFTYMKDNLTSENKLLSAKINSLDEFRTNRSNLLDNYEQLEQKLKDQETKYEQMLYDCEKKYIIAKDNLRKEMEGRLLQLALDFQDASEIRIAASTHRLIRENITINNELDKILQTQAKLAADNKINKDREQTAQASLQLVIEERDKAIKKSLIQTNVIEQLTNAIDDIKLENADNRKKDINIKILQKKIESLTEEIEKLYKENDHINKKMFEISEEKNKITSDSKKTLRDYNELKNILNEAANALQSGLNIDQLAPKDSPQAAMNRQYLLTHLFDIISQEKEIRSEFDQSDNEVYNEGDLGFIPKQLKRLSPMTLRQAISKIYEASDSGFIPRGRTRTSTLEEATHQRQDILEDSGNKIFHEEDDINRTIELDPKISRTFSRQEEVSSEGSFQTIVDERRLVDVKDQSFDDDEYDDTQSLPDDLAESDIETEAGKVSKTDEE